MQRGPGTFLRKVRVLLVAAALSARLQARKAKSEVMNSRNMELSTASLDDSGFAPLLDEARYNEFHGEGHADSEARASVGTRGVGTFGSSSNRCSSICSSRCLWTAHFSPSICLNTATKSSTTRQSTRPIAVAATRCANFPL